MTTARRNHLTTDYIRSPFISERRRKLFPTEDHDVDSELGHISPISSDETSESDNENCDVFDRVAHNKIAQGSATPINNRAESETMSPLKLSPCTDNYLRETPRRFSPSQNLKTPHDTSTKPVLEKEQKILLEESKSLKRKASPHSSPEQSKYFKSDMKSSKVRTALFPPDSALDMSLSTKSFYSKNQENILEKLSLHREKYNFKPTKFNTAKRHRHVRKLGQINNGVRHKIRKPRQKKLSKRFIAKATSKMLETGAALNEYMQALSELKNKQNTEHKLIQHPEGKSDPVKEDPEMARYLREVKELQKRQIENKKLISNPKQTQMFTEENKENVNTESRERSFSPVSIPSSPDSTKNRKFFKSSRAKPNKPFCKENEETKTFTIPTVESAVPEKVTLDSHNDFEDDTEPVTNIDNILSVLSAESPQKTIDDNSSVRYSSFNNENGFETSYTQISENTQAIAETCDQDVDSEQYPQLPSELSAQIDYTYECDQENDFEFNLSSDTSAYSSQIQSSQVVFQGRLLDDITVPDEEIHHNKSLLPAITTILTYQQPQISSTITLEAHNTITASENSIQLHQPDFANIILSPISHMCDVTSGLAINSPRKGRDLTPFLGGVSRVSKMLSFNGDCHSVDMEDQTKKLFPIFVKDSQGQSQESEERGKKRERNDIVKRSAKRFKALPPDQMLLDAGQKRFGFTLCNECNIVYHMGDPNDEIQHSNYHNAYHILRFSGWKNEHVVADFHSQGRIIRVLPTDPKIWLSKVKDLMKVVIRDLGCYEMEYYLNECQVYLYIKSRTIAGCAVAAVPKENGHRILDSLVSDIVMCSEESYPIKCGISHLWVASNFRKQGIASALLDAVKNSFIYGYVLSNEDIALTSPTEDGAAFAQKYFKTPNYLIYYT